jgi:O-antigen/teichoic acid export membrane protein
LMVRDWLSRRRIGAEAGDRMIRNAAFLTAAMGTMALLGFGFSFVIAHLYTPAQVGAGMSLVSATSLIAYLSLFGLNVTVVRFYANTPNRNAAITQSLLIVGGFGLLFSAAYVVFVPMYAPELSAVRDNMLYAVVFLVAGTASSMNLLTDFVFIGARQTQYNLLIDGFVQGITKLLFPAALIGLGAFGIFASVGASFVVALSVSLWCMSRVLKLRADFRAQTAISKAQVGYSISSYLSSVFSIAPIMVLPLVAVHKLGEAEAGYFFLAFQIANTLYSVAYAISEAFFAEGSFDPSRHLALLKRSAVLLVSLMAPAVVVLIVGGRLLLGIFGAGYADHAVTLLQVLAVAAIPVALNTWAGAVLKLMGLMKSLVISSATFAVISVVMAQLWADRGLVWLGLAWLVGNFVAGLYAAVAIAVHRIRSVDQAERLRLRFTPPDIETRGVLS